VTRWREDATSDCWGQFFCIRDLDGAARGRPAGSRLVETPTTTRHCSVRIGPSSSGAMERSKRVPSSGRHVAEVRERRLDEYRSTAGRQAPANRRGDESYDRRAHPDRSEHGGSTRSRLHCPHERCGTHPRLWQLPQRERYVGHFERPGPVTTRFAVPGTRCQIALSSQLLTALTRR